jgi:hypothetical protein
MLVTPDTWRQRVPKWDDGSDVKYALDNGAWGCFNRGEDFNWRRFTDMVNVLGPGADWVIAPDIVCGGVKSLAVSVKWRKDFDACPVLIAVQDGMTVEDVRPHLGKRTGIAVGGSTEFKKKSLPYWSKLSSDVGCHLHVLRVNTRRRLMACSVAGAHSVDGTSASVFSSSAPLIRGWTDELEKQPCLELWK